MTSNSPPSLLVLHAVRIVGFADNSVIASRYAINLGEATEILRDAEARGWVQHAAFADLEGWFLTESGRVENECQLAGELARIGKADELCDIYRDFLPLNTRLQQACTDWQLRPAPGNRLDVNDHSDPEWDRAILEELNRIDLALVPLAERLNGVLARFRGYDTRFSTALRRAHAGERNWVDSTHIDSCHRVWFELHEDLIATLGLDRQTKP